MNFYTRNVPIDLLPFELPLQPGSFEPVGMNTIHSYLRDVAPGAWGRSVFILQHNISSFKLRAREFHMDLLTPSQGPETGKPVYLPHFNSYAHPMRFLEYLLEDCQDAVILFRSGIFVNVPNPARFALHKLVVSQRRPLAQQIKARKDIQQATELLNILLEDRPGDIWIAVEAALAMQKRFQSRLAKGIEQLPAAIKKVVSTHFNPAVIR